LKIEVFKDSSAEEEPNKGNRKQLHKTVDEQCCISFGSVISHIATPIVAVWLCG